MERTKSETRRTAVERSACRKAEGEKCQTLMTHDYSAHVVKHRAIATAIAPDCARAAVKIDVVHGDRDALHFVTLWPPVTTRFVAR